MDSQYVDPNTLCLISMPTTIGQCRARSSSLLVMLFAASVPLLLWLLLIDVHPGAGQRRPTGVLTMASWGTTGCVWKAAPRHWSQLHQRTAKCILYSSSCNQNPFDTLGLQRSATTNDVRGAFRRLAKLYHPDVPDTGNAEKFRTISEAAAELSTAEGCSRWSTTARASYSYASKAGGASKKAKNSKRNAKHQGKWRTKATGYNDRAYDYDSYGADGGYGDYDDYDSYDDYDNDEQRRARKTSKRKSKRASSRQQKRWYTEDFDDDEDGGWDDDYSPWEPWTRNVKSGRKQKQGQTWGHRRAQGSSPDIWAECLQHARMKARQGRKEQEQLWTNTISKFSRTSKWKHKKQEERVNKIFRSAKAGARASKREQKHQWNAHFEDKREEDRLWKEQEGQRWVRMFQEMDEAASRRKEALARHWSEQIRHVKDLRRTSSQQLEVLLIDSIQKLRDFNIKEMEDSAIEWGEEMRKLELLRQETRERERKQWEEIFIQAACNSRPTETDDWEWRFSEAMREDEEESNLLDNTFMDRLFKAQEDRHAKEVKKVAVWEAKITRLIEEFRQDMQSQASDFAEKFRRSMNSTLQGQRFERRKWAAEYRKAEKQADRQYTEEADKWVEQFLEANLETYN